MVTPGCLDALYDVIEFNAFLAFRLALRLFHRVIPATLPFVFCDHPPTLIPIGLNKQVGGRGITLECIDGDDNMRQMFLSPMFPQKLPELRPHVSVRIRPVGPNEIKSATIVIVSQIARILCEAGMA